MKVGHGRIRTKVRVSGEEGGKGALVREENVSVEKL